MPRRNTYSVLVVAAVCLTLIPAVSGFGYLAGSTQQDALVDGEVHFRPYLYGTNESVKVTRVEAPGGWRVNVNPHIVNFPVQDGYRYVQAANSYRKVVPLDVRIHVPLNATAGQHTVTVVLTGAAASEPEGSGVAVKQLQDFAYTVHVVDGRESADERNENDDDTGETGAEDAFNSASGGGIQIQGGNQNTDRTPTGRATAPSWKKRAVLLLLFEITWGIALIYVLKRKEYL